MKNQGNKYLTEDVRRTKVLMLLFSIAACGILLGTFVFSRAEDKSIFLSDVLSNGFIKRSEAQSVIDVFNRTVSWTSLIVLILFFSGLSSITQPLEIAVLFYRGVAIGSAVSYTYTGYGKDGFPIVLLMILPYALMSTVIIVFAVREALRSSNVYLMYLSGHAPDEACRPSLKLYLTRFAVLFLFVFLSSVIDCVITYFLTDILILKNK